MKILALDPGSRLTGYAAVKVDRGKVLYLGSGVLKFSAEIDFLHRLPEIFKKTNQHFRQFDFDILSLETLINVKNINSLAKLAQARGALVSALSRDRSLMIKEYSPNLVKSCVTGFGHADKKSVGKTLSLIFREDFKFETDDESDALAIAYCCAVNCMANFKEIR
tara:strand:- start:630 stop:1124 length:495 start_codon:yes stop_codon:yes gene_type:complete